MKYTYLSRVNMLAFLALIFLTNFTYGQVWKNQHPFEQSNKLYDIEINENGVGYTVGKSGVIFKTNDFGQNWERQTTPIDYHLFVVKMIDDEIAIAGGLFGRLRTKNGGQTWEKLNVGMNITATRDIEILENGDIILSSDSGIVVKSSDNGNTWSPLNAPQGNEWWHSAHGSDDVLFMSTKFGEIYRSDDGGANWNETTSNTFDRVWIMDFVDENIGFVGSHEFIYKTTDGGYTWNPLADFDAQGYIVDFFVLNEMEIYAILAFGTVYRTTDGGMTWEETPTLSYADNNSLMVHPDGKIWVAGDFNSVAFTEEFNEPWVDQFPANKNYLQFVEMQNADFGFAGGWQGTLFKTEDGGENWNQIDPIAESHADLKFDSNGAIYSACYGDGIFKSTDNGETWNQVLSISGSHNTPFVFTTPSGNVHTFSNKWWGDEGTNFYSSTDGGMTWNTNFVSHGSAIRYMCFASDLTGYASGHNGFFLKTSDGGQTWDSLSVDQTNEDLDGMFFLNEDIGYVLGEWNLFKTEDGGQTWTSTNILPQSRKIVFLNKQVGWYIGHNYLSGFVAETRDGGETWDIQWEIDGFYRDLSLANDGSEKLWAAGQGGFITHYNGVVSSVQNIEMEDLSIYPNPTNGFFTIDFEEDDLSDKSVQIFDNSGKIVFEMSYQNQSDLNIQLDTSLPSGMYWVRAISNKVNYLGKVFKE